MTTVTLSVLASVYLFLGILLAARRKPGYSHVRHTLSELGEVGAPQQRLVAFGIFLPVGLLLALAAYLTRASNPPQAALALSVAVGYVVAAFFPCDPGSPFSGSLRQGAHNLGGAVEYVGGAFSLLWLSESLGQPFRGAGLVVGVALIALSFPSPFRGLIQRVAELCLFGGLALSLWLVRGAV